MSALGEQVRENPMNWKDWLNGIGLLLTIATVLIQGGRMVERQDQANAKLAELTGQIAQVRSDLAAAQRDLTAQVGTDRLHDEQITALRREMDEMRARRSVTR